MLTVIIPTMWKYRPFLQFLPHILDSACVSQVILIDNDSDARPKLPELWSHEKLHMVSHGKNLLVNPSWNLGVQLAQTEKLCILNDDVIFDTRIFSLISPVMDSENFGVAGAHPGEEHLFQQPFRDGLIDIVPWENPPPGRSHGYLFGFGTLFFINKSKWVPIPDSFPIYYGDDWVHLTQDTYDRYIYLITNMFYSSPSSQTCSNILTEEERTHILSVEREAFNQEVAIFRDAAYQEYIEGEYTLACTIKSDINEHIPTLRALAQECERVVELGVREGWSTRAFLCQRNRLRSYDIIKWPYVEHLFNTMKNVGRDFNYIQASSLDIELEECDLIFFDTEHTYEQLSQELALHGNKATKYLVFHDTVTYHEQLVPAIEEFMQNNLHWQIKDLYYNNNGLTVLERIYD